jgi:hypothetical protein
MPLNIDNLNTAPYYDTTLQELEKGYVKFLAIEGQVLQNRELNVAQGLIQGNIRKITDLIIEDGSIVSGCNFVNNVGDEICTLEPGEVYFNGLLIKVPKTEWAYNQVPTGMAYVCLEIQQKIYTENDDPSLYDPAENIENKGNRGGHRLKYEVTPVIKTVEEYESEAAENKNLIAIIQLKDRDTYGPIKPKPIFNKIYKQMAERTYDADGDFIAEGLRVYTETSDYPEYKYNIRITKGRAYVKGYNYTYEKDQYILQDLALTTRSNESLPEIKSFIVGTTSYPLNKKYVNNIINVTSFMKISNVDMTGYSDNVLSALTDTTYNLASDKIQITGVTVNGYSSGDYSFDFNTNTIVWNIQTPPTSYTVNVDVTADLTENEDYFISREGDTSIINFKNTSMVRDDTQSFTVVYSWFLSRYDLVYMTEDGYLKVKNGIPNELELIKHPNVPAGSLPLAYIRVEPGLSPDEFHIESFDIYRVPTIQLQSMKRKINDLEYNFAMTKLEQQAQNKHLETDDIYKLKNIFADAITNYDRIDIDDRRFDATVDIIRSEVKLPIVIDKVDYNDISFRKNDGTTTTDKLLTLDIISNKVADFQPYITHTIDIAPYYYKGLIPKVVCDPKKLTYIEDLSPVNKIIWLPNRIIYSSKTVESWRTVTVRRTVSGRIAGRPQSITTTQTSTKTNTTYVGEEIVETKVKAVDTVPAPYIKAGSVLKIIGYDFPANYELQLLLDNEKLIKPEFSNVTSYDPIDVNPETLIFTDGTNSWMPNVWKWTKAYWNGGWYWKLTHPAYNGKQICLYYNETDNSWQYEKTGFGVGVDGAGSITNLPSWIKLLRRAPWWQYYWIQETDQNIKDLIQTLNTTETVSGISYNTTYDNTNIAIVTDSDGYFEVEIEIPEKVPVGKHSIIAETILPEDYNIGRYAKAYDEFTGESYIRHWENEIYKRKVYKVEKTVYITKTTTRFIYVRDRSRRSRRSRDPIAQSFVFNEDQFLTGIDLYFAKKGVVEENAKIWFNIREMDNGYPTGSIIYQKELKLEDINFPTTSNLFPVTHISFDYPVYCAGGKEYAFSLGCNVDGITVYCAKMGNRDLVTNDPVIYQPHPSGVMFTSSNNSTWTPIQDSDITYTLYRADFDTNDKIYYVYYVNEQCDNTSAQFKLMNISLSDAVLENTDIKYEYCITNASPDIFDPSTEEWKDLILEEMYELEMGSDMKLYIRATLSSEDSKVTPAINTESFEAFFGKYKTLGSYILKPLNIG